MLPSTAHSACPSTTATAADISLHPACSCSPFLRWHARGLLRLSHIRGVMSVQLAGAAPGGGCGSEVEPARCLYGSCQAAVAAAVDHPSGTAVLAHAADRRQGLCRRSATHARGVCADGPCITHDSMPSRVQRVRACATGSHRYSDVRAGGHRVGHHGTCMGAPCGSFLCPMQAVRGSGLDHSNAFLALCYGDNPGLRKTQAPLRVA